jgi:SSS family solute:Na+ symporter
VVTILVSLMTLPRPEPELVGLTYALTPKIHDERGAWYTRPVILGWIMIAAAVILNLIFR